MSCDAKCWTRVTCESCHRTKQPNGRSVPLEAANGYCSYDCQGYGREPTAPHLFSEHDSNRHYSDPDGWSKHEASCEQCKPKAGCIICGDTPTVDETDLCGPHCFGDSSTTGGNW